MKTSTVMVAVMAFLGMTAARSMLGFPSTQIFEEEVLKFIEEVKSFLKQHDPLNVENVQIDQLGYWIELSKLWGEGFSEFEVTALKINILRQFDAQLELPSLAAKAGPLKGGCPHGEVFTTGDSHFEVGKVILHVKGTVELLPKVHVTDLWFELEVNGASCKLNGVNDDPEYTKEVNHIANVFLKDTINDPEWQESVTKDVEDLINQVLELIL